MTAYLGFDVLEQEADAGEARQDAVTRARQGVFPALGLEFAQSPWSAPSVLRAFRWVATTRAAVTAIRTFIDARRGRLVPFWLPCLESDFTPSTTPGLGNAITINSIGYAANLFPLGGVRRHVWIYNRSHATRVYRKVIAAVDNGNGTETLTLDSNIGVNAQTNWHYGFLRLVRLEDDVPSIEWESGGVAEVALRLRELPMEAPA